MSETRFARYSLSTKERVLRFDGEIVSLPPKAIDMLAELLQFPNAVVSKDDLMLALWGASPVEEGNLTQIAFRLRRAFEQHDPSVRIETVPRRGYRLVVPPDATTSSQSACPEQTGARKPAYVSVGVLVALAAVAAIFIATERHEPSVPASLRLGYYYWSNAKTTNDVRRSIGSFREALREVPQNAAAHAGLAYALVSLALRENSPAHVARDANSALAEAHEAVALDPALAEAHAALGQAEAEFGDTTVAAKEFRQAVKLDPSSVEARTWYGEFLLGQARVREARVQFRAALSANSTWTEAGDNLALLAYLNRDISQAQAYARQSLAQDPNDRFARLVLALSESIHRRAAAEADVLDMLHQGHSPDALADHAMLAYLYERDGRTALASVQLREAQRIAGRVGVVADPFTIISFAGAFAAAHRTDDAFAWLSRLNHQARLMFANDSRLDKLRGNPRFVAWMRGV